MGVFDQLALRQMARPQGKGVFDAMGRGFMGGGKLGGMAGGGVEATAELTDGEPGADLERILAGATAGVALGAPGGMAAGGGARMAQAGARGAGDLIAALKTAGLSKPEQVVAYFKRLGRPPTPNDVNDVQAMVGRLTPEEMQQVRQLMQAGAPPAMPGAPPMPGGGM